LWQKKNLKKIEIFRFFSVNSKKMAKILEKISKLGNNKIEGGEEKKQLNPTHKPIKNKSWGIFPSLSELVLSLI
jgi:hypothetical protein